MTRDEYIRRARQNGWILWSSKNGTSSFCCEHIGCKNTKIIADDKIARGKVMRPCTWQHRKGFSGDLIQSHLDLMQHLRNRRLRLGLSQEDVEAAAGLTPDHLGKIETLARLPQFPIYLAIAETLGYDIALVPKGLPAQTLAIICHKAGRPERDQRLPTAWAHANTESAERGLSALESIA